jgi:hypothetical protein
MAARGQHIRRARMMIFAPDEALNQILWLCNLFEIANHSGDMRLDVKSFTVSDAYEGRIESWHVRSEIYLALKCWRLVGLFKPIHVIEGWRGGPNS